VTRVLGLPLLGEDLANLDDPDFGPVTFRLDSYGQGETAKLSQRAQADPLARLEYLHRFIDLRDATKAEDSARDQLLELQSKIEDAEEKVGQIPQFERSLATTRQQLKASEKANAAEVIQLQRKLATEREIRNRIVLEWRELKAIIAGEETKDKIETIRDLADPGEMTVGATELKKIVAAANILVTQIDTAGEEIQKQVSTFDAVILEQIRLWKAKESEAARAIETKRTELEAHGVRLDMAFIQKLAKDEAVYEKSLQALRTWKPHLLKLRQQRAEIVRQRWAARDRVATIRDAYARLASNTLKTTLSDLQVSLKFVRNGCAPEAAEQIQQVMGWRTSQVPRATLLTQKLRYRY
jgi:vacuolar-type H+-ATPase subunit I/STV1